MSEFLEPLKAGFDFLTPYPYLQALIVICARASFLSCDEARLTWQVLDWNTEAMASYAKLPDALERRWLTYKLPAEGVAVLGGLLGKIL